MQELGIVQRNYSGYDRGGTLRMVGAKVIQPTVTIMDGTTNNKQQNNRVAMEKCTANQQYQSGCWSRNSNPQLSRSMNFTQNRNWNKNQGI